MWQKGDVIGCMLDMTDKTISEFGRVFQHPSLQRFHVASARTPLSSVFGRVFVRALFIKGGSVAEWLAC